MRNPFRRAFLIKSVGQIETDDMILSRGMRKHITSMTNILGVSIINSTRPRKNRIDKIVEEQEEGQGSKSGSHIFTLPDGTEVEVLPNSE